MIQNELKKLVKKKESIKTESAADIGSQSKKGEDGRQTNSDSDYSFQKHYNKELRVSQDEVPIVLNELNDSALRYIERDQYDKALILFQKAHGIINVITLDHWRRDQHFAFVIFHNMAACYQHTNSLEEASVAIDNALTYLGDYSSLKNQSISQRINYLEVECRTRMQLWALYSQQHRHKDALEQAMLSIKLIHIVFKDLDALWKFYIQKSFDEELEIIEEHLNLRSEEFNEEHLTFYESITKMMTNSPYTAIAATK